MVLLIKQTHFLALWNVLATLLIIYILYNPQFYDGFRKLAGKALLLSYDTESQHITGDELTATSHDSESDVSRRLSATNDGGNTWHTYEECYIQSDESENCFYKGPVCFDGSRVFVVTAEELNLNHRGISCYDIRHQVPKGSCDSDDYTRTPLEKPESLADLQELYPSKPYTSQGPLSLGPLGFDFPMAGLTSETFQSEYIDQGRVTWSDKNLYFLHMHHSWTHHIWHFATATMGLYDIKRYNRTLPEVIAQRNGFEGAVRDTRFQGGMYVAPPIDELFFLGEEVDFVTEPPPSWITDTLSLLVQNHTNVHWQPVPDALYSHENVLCSNTAALVGLKPQLFTGRGDLQSFRLMALAKFGIEVDQSLDPEWPPMRITLISRSTTRGIVNLPQVVNMLRSTGLDVEWITSMGRLSSKEQAELISRTGILIASHGAALTNLMFLPPFASVVELFPYGMYASMYHDLARVGGYYYHKVPSDRPPKEVAPMHHDDEFISKCDGIGVRRPSAYGYLLPECNLPGKVEPMLVNLDKFSKALEMAMDEIGCRDRICYRHSRRIPLIHRNASFVVQKPY